VFTPDDDEPLPDEAAIRSRMLMQDVPRFTEVHRYRAVVVENVTDVLKWEHLGEWALTDPLPAQTSVAGDALIGTRVPVQDCTFRMLTVDEIRGGMAFRPGYVLLGTSIRDKVRMLGNAVTPPVARDLVAAVVEAITGEPIDPT